MLVVKYISSAVDKIAQSDIVYDYSAVILSTGDDLRGGACVRPHK